MSSRMALHTGAVSRSPPTTLTHTHTHPKLDSLPRYCSEHTGSHESSGVSVEEEFLISFMFGVHLKLKSYNICGSILLLDVWRRENASPGEGLIRIRP